MNIFKFGNARKFIVVGIIDGSRRLEIFRVNGFKFHIYATIGQRAEFQIKKFVKLSRVKNLACKFAVEQINFAVAQVYDFVKIRVQHQLNIFVVDDIFD